MSLASYQGQKAAACCLLKQSTLSSSRWMQRYKANQTFR
uniref:Uncharacterized protein n=1 Tax=Arundo donax TaxID=35708 RepID=A0A0A9ARJ6_ARUDO